MLCAGLLCSVDQAVAASVLGRLGPLLLREASQGIVHASPPGSSPPTALASVSDRHAPTPACRGGRQLGSCAAASTPCTSSSSSSSSGGSSSGGKPWQLGSCAGRLIAWQPPVASAVAQRQPRLPLGAMLSLVRAMAAEARAAPAVHEDEHDGQSLSDANMSADEFRAMHDMRVFDDAGGTPPDPIRTFEEAGFPEQLMKMVKNAGFDKPTHVQSQAWPIATSGRDLIAIANTGSGKTAGYLVPALAHIREATRKAVAAASATGARPSTAAFVLIVAPTRELARQIQQEALKFGAPLGLRTACLYGGSSRGPQTTELFRHPHIIIGTPGRLIDFAESGELDLSRVSYLVLDEADRMLDMGFEPQLAKLSRYLARERQTLFFSATWPPAVQSIAERFACNRPVKLFVGNVSDRAVAATTIKQLFEVVETPGEKVQVLADYLASKPRNCKVLVFVARKARCEWLHHALSPAS